MANNPEKTHTKICIKCGREFTSNRSNKRICDSCQNGDENSIFKCKFCGKPIKYSATFCSYSCNSKYNVSVYQPFQDKEIIDRIQLLANERKENDPEYLKKINEKTRATKLKKYGSETFNNSERAKQTCLEKYDGTGFASMELREKGNNTTLERYGGKVYNNREKAKQTCIEKYGVDNIYKDIGFIKNKKIEKNGSLEISYQKGKENTIKSNLEKYGVEWYTQTPEYKEYMKQYHEQKINDSKIATRNQEKFSDEFKELLYDREKSVDFLKDNNYTIYELTQKLECSNTAIIHWINRLDLRRYIQFNTCSHFEVDIKNYFTNIPFEQHARILNGKEIDLYAKECNLGIEFNGTYWHSILNKNKTFHEDKSKLAESLGIRLIHVYEYEWEDETKNKILKSIINIASGNIQNKIYARNCDIKQLTNKDVKEFTNNNHIQGHRNAQIVYGLFYNNELVQIMTFSKHKKYDYEIIRECSKLNTVVVGGTSKLFKHFLNDYNPNTVFSYCDFNKFNGNSYEKLGMKFLGFTGPDMKWVIDGKVYNRNPRKNQELKNLAETQIFGAGSKKYLWEKG